MKIFGLNSLKTGTKSGAAIILASIIGLSSVSTANAGNFGIDLYLGNGTGIHYNDHYGHNRHHYKQRRYKHHNKRRSHYRDQYRPRQHQQVCGPRRAVKKAYRMGLDSPRVHRVKQNRIVVSGYQYGYRAKMVFKRYSRCHLIKTVRFN